MTTEEKDRLIAYLVDAGEIDPDGDVESQFLEWDQVREQVCRARSTTKHSCRPLETRTETPILPKSSFSQRRLSM